METHSPSPQDMIWLKHELWEYIRERKYNQSLPEAHKYAQEQ